MTKNLLKLKKDLKSFAKKCKDFKYTDSALVSFLLCGNWLSVNLFSAGIDKSIESQKQEIFTSIKTINQKVKETRQQNNKLLRNTNLELIQLMEQGDYVIKSPWSSWQYGMNYFYNNWRGTYKGRGDKKEKYPYEGMFERDTNEFNRYVTPESPNYSFLSRGRNPRSASSSNREGIKSGYGIASNIRQPEPIVTLELTAGIKPRNISKEAITIPAKTAVTPKLPKAIDFTPPKPTISNPDVPNLPAPPTFNIQLGSYCNNMNSTGCNSYNTDGGQYGYGTASKIGTPRSYSSNGNNTITNITNNDPSLRYGWANNSGGNSALLYSYFDVTGNTTSGTTTLNNDLTITSINPLNGAQRAAESGAGRTYNAHDFLVGGSRIATLDNVKDGTLVNKGKINLIGPLVVGFEVQTDNVGSGTRKIENQGTITDAAEPNDTKLQTLLPVGTSKSLELANFGTSNPPITVKNTKGFTGYKIGLILTLENTKADDYNLTNNKLGTISFNGENSIGIQIFAPHGPFSPKVVVKNGGNINMGGKESYGMKWSSRTSSTSTMDNDNTGTINISGDNGNDNSLSSGIAVIENEAYKNKNSIRAWNNNVTNNGTINVSGGNANTGMVLIVNANDDITNTSKGTINVHSEAKKQNIAMRVEKGKVSTDDVSGKNPKAINNGNIYLSGDSSMGLVSTDADVTNATGAKIKTAGGKTIINGIGIVNKGGKLENEGEIELKGTGDSNNVGIYMAKGSNNPNGTSTGNITVTGDGSTGVLITNGTLNYAGAITSQGNGVAGIIVGDNNTENAVVNASGSLPSSITVNNGTTAAGVYTDSKNRVRGSYGMVVGKNSTFNQPNTKVDINVTGKESIGIYAGENSKVTIGKHTVKAYDGAVNYDASDASTITLNGTGNAETGKKSLLFYNGKNGSGKFLINFHTDATIKGDTDVNKRGTAFYYVGSGNKFDKAAITSWAANNFGGTLSNLYLTMDPGSRLFIAQNVKMDLTDTTASGFSSYTGAHITDNGMKSFMLYLSELSINNHVNLDNASDPYNQLEISNSKITNENTKTITGTKADQVAMAQENNSSLYTRDKVRLTNKGNINLSGTGSTGMYTKFGEIINDTTGKMQLGDNSTAMYGTYDSQLTNKGNITIGSSSTGMYSEGSTTNTGFIKNDITGIIETTGNDSVAMSYKPDATLAAGTVLENAGNIKMTGDRNTAIYATGTPVYTTKNSGTITLGDSASMKNPNVGIYTDSQNVTMENIGSIISGSNTIGMYGYKAQNSGNITVGNAGIGIYSQSGNVNLTSGSIKVGNDEAVAVYTAGTGQTITNSGTTLNIGDNSIGIVNVGAGNTIVSTNTVPTVNLGNKAIYIYNNKASTVVNDTNLTSTGNENYGIYSAGTVTNTGNIDFSSGIGNVGIYSISGGTATNSGVISVGTSDISPSNPDDRKYSLGMAAGYRTTDKGTVINNGTINIKGNDSIGMYATGNGSVARNGATGTINLGADGVVGMYLDEQAKGYNDGVIQTIPTAAGEKPKAVVGVVVRKGATLYNTGTIHIESPDGIAMFQANGGIIHNTGTITLGASGAAENGETETGSPGTATSKEAGAVKIDAPKGAAEATITVNGIPVTPEAVTLTVGERDMLTSSLGMYIDTLRGTNPIKGLATVTDAADLIIGTEATKVSNSKYIKVSDDILKPYNDTIDQSGITNWNIYSGSFTWMATATLGGPSGYINNLYLAKRPYTEFAGNEITPVNSSDTYNFLDGLEQRYGVESLDSREKQLFLKLNNIGKNEKILFYQATDEMMGHQYGNTQQRINETASLLDKEFTYLRHDWRNPSKQNNKIKVFGMRNEYNSDTAGIIDYRSNAYGVAYVHEDEKIKMGNSSGWYAGAVTNRFKFKDIGKSRENQTILKAGIFKTMSPKKDHNGALQWTIGADAFVGINDMRRRYLIVDEVFEAKSNYNSYGAALKTDLGYDIRMSERTHLRPYGSLKMEYGRFNSIREKSGQVRLEVEGNDYFSVKPEVGAEFRYVQPLAIRTNLTVGLKAAYENELGKVGDVNNKGRVRYTNADWFGIRGEKEDRKGNGKFDLNIGVDNTRFGVTVNAGYDTKGKNVRGGIGFRMIY